MEGKKSAESLIIMTELVLPNDTNTFGNLMGGRLMYWMDIGAALSATKHCGAPVVTASVDNISFTNPIKLGNVVHIEAYVCRAFNTSMEIYLKVWGEDLLHQYKYESNEAFFTFVALDPNGKPRLVPPVIPETESEPQSGAGREAPRDRESTRKNSRRSRDRVDSPADRGHRRHCRTAQRQPARGSHRRGGVSIERCRDG